MKYMEYKDLCFKESCEISRIQNMMLKHHLEFVLRNSQFYKNRFKNIDLKNIGIENLKDLPTTTKKDIEKHHSDFITCQDKDIAEIVCSSGTSGKPTKIFYTENDLKRLEYNEFQALTNCGITKKDKVLLTCTIDRCFIAGLAYFLGARAIGAATIRNGANSLESHLKLIKDLKPNVIIGVPSFLLKLANFAKEGTSVPSELGIGKLVCIGEPLRIMKDGKLQPTNLCSKIEELWGAKAYSTYASTEMITSFCECNMQDGGHLIPELGIIEILDEEGNPLPPGELGEVTVTPFHLEAMPLVRYRTGDMAALLKQPCKCGRNSVRLSGISGRKYQMIKYKGTTLYPSAINAVLDGFDGIQEYQVIVKTDDLSDKVSVSVAHNDKIKTEEIEKTLQAVLRVKINTIRKSRELIEAEIFPDGSRKPVRLIFGN